MSETPEPAAAASVASPKARCIIQQCTSAKLLTQLADPANGLEEEAVEVTLLLTLV